MQSNSTIATYESILTKYKDLADDLLNTKYILLYLGHLGLSSSYIKTILCAIQWKLKKEHKETNNAAINIYKEVISTMRSEQTKQEMNHEKKHGFIPEWEDVIMKREELPKGGKEHLILSLYSYVPPRRLKDYVLLKVVSNDDEHKDVGYNYYVRNNKQFIFNVYKTAKKHKAQKINIGDELADIINKYVDANNIGIGDLLLNFKNYHQILYKLNKLVGCSVDNLRHSYVNNAYKDYNMPPSDFIQQLSYKMGHTIESNLNYRKI